MTLVTLRPNATTQLFTGAAVTGAASAHAALADDLDSSYVYLPASGAGMVLGFTDLALPAGALVRSSQIRVRESVYTNNATYLLIGGSAPVGYLLIYGQTALTISFPLDVREQSAAFIDAYLLTLLRLKGLPTSAYIFAVYLDVVYVTKPAVVANGPAGAVTTTNLPEASWTSTLDVDGGRQTHYEVRIFNAAQYGAVGFDPATSPAAVASGKLAGDATTWTPTVPLPDGTYRAYVRVWQDFRAGAGHASDFAFSAFTIAVNLPAPPTVALTAVHAGGHISILINGVAGPTTTQGIELLRSLDDGATWDHVRTDRGLVDRFLQATYPLPVTILDHEAPNGVPVMYRARALHDYAGLYAASAWTTATTTWSSPDWWIKNPLAPWMNITAPLKGYGPVARAARQGVHQPLGAALPIVISDTRAGAAGQTTIRTDTTQDLAKLDAILSRPGTLLLQGPSFAGEPDRYVRFGDQVGTRLVENARKHRRDVAVSWVEVARPTGGLT